MDMNTVFPSKFLKASDLQDKAVVVTIERVEMDSITDDTTKPVVYFVGKEKGLVLNKTNTKTISNLYGGESDEWAGKSITIYPTETDFQGERVECIRVKIKRPATPVAEGGLTREEVQTELDTAAAKEAADPGSDIPF